MHDNITNKMEQELLLTSEVLSLPFSFPCETFLGDYKPPRHPCIQFGCSKDCQKLSWVIIHVVAQLLKFLIHVPVGL